jgi:hypothetical protein
MGSTTTVKKKINLFIAMILSVTMLFGSTVCFAAENDAEVDNTLSVQSNESVRAARSMTDSKPVTINVGATGVIAYVNLNYAWDEGYTGWFTGASLTGTYVPVGTSLVLRDFTTSDVGNSSYITVTVTYIINGAQYNASATFYVDEWGEVS